MTPRPILRMIAASATFCATLAVNAATCPFDSGASDAVNDGVVLTRYALGISGAPLVASTRYASLDPLQVKNNIECVGCSLDMNGDNAIDTVDTTIIARHLAGFKGASLTNGLALGSGTRNTPSSVQSFLASGCAVGGAINAFVQGGNSFGAPALLGSNDAQPLTVQSNGAQLNVVLAGGNGLRAIQTAGARANAPNIVTGSSANLASQFVEGSATTVTQGATLGGGGSSESDCFEPSNSSLSRRCGNEARNSFAVVSGGQANHAKGKWSSIGGGASNTAGGESSVIAGGAENGTTSNFGTVSGGRSNYTTQAFATVSGGTGNLASGISSTVSGGTSNLASGLRSIVPGGTGNVASGISSFAAGSNAQALHDGAFVWSDEGGGFSSTGSNQFNIRASGGVRLSNDTSQFFGAQTRQMLNLWSTDFGIGVQSNTLYYRSGGQFSWFIGGEHCDLPNCPYPFGGTVGTENMRLTSTQLLVNGTFVQGSDRAIKENFTKVDAKRILAKVAELPLSMWNYRSDDKKTQHLGPMAQDFKRLFGIGQDDKTIATVDAAGVAFAAIKGLHARLVEKDAEIAVLRKKADRVDQIERELAAIKRRLGM